MGLQPVDHGEQALPRGREFEHLQRAFGQPGDKTGLACAREPQQPFETLGVGPLADQRERLVQTVEPGRLRHALGAEHAVIEIAPFDAQMRDGGQFGDPAAHRLEAVGQFGRAWALERQA